ncbi:MAG: hypothetical protein V4864_17575 [Pseudomonadota bacterium]
MNEPLLGLDAWPGVAADYDVLVGAANAPALRLRLVFDAAAYSPVAVAVAAQPAEPAEAPAWQLAALQALPAYELLAGQLDAVAIACASSLLPGGEQVFDGAQRTSLLDWLFGEGGVRAFLLARSEGDAALPAPAAWTTDLAFARDIQVGPLFELSTSITLSRAEQPADADALEDAPQDSRATTFLAPREEGDGLAGFAGRIEAGLSVPGACMHKLAASVDDGRKRLWLVRLGLAENQPIRLRLAGTDGPLLFALRPLFTAPQSRTGVPYYDYVPGQGIDFGNASGTSTLADVDVETWVREVVAAVDAVDAPECAAELQAVKAQLGQALSRLVVPVLADQAPDAAQRAAAQEAFRRQALLGLSAAHASDALVQFATVATAAEVVPPWQLHGSLLPRAGSDAHAVLTPASVTLRNARDGATEPLTFLVTAMADDGTKPRAIALDLNFRPLHIQAGPSWLFFVLPPDTAGDWPLDLSLGRFDVPIPLRSLRPAPSLLEQEAVTRPMEAPGGWPEVAQALKWDFRFTWEDAGHPQDTMHCVARFNDDMAEPMAAAPATAADPLPALFAFVRAWPQLQADLEGAPDPLAQRTFVQLAQNVAGALSAFVPAAPGPHPALPSEVMSVPAAQRAVTIEGLDVVAVQRARARLQAERNQGLLPGRRTADAFVLRTATAAFSSAVRPMVRIVEAVDLAAVGGDAPVVRPLAEQLGNALSVLFAHAPAQSQTLQVAAAYTVAIAGAPPDVTVSLPVLFTPPMQFQPKRAAPSPAAGDDGAIAQDQLVAQLRDRVQEWFAQQQPQPGGDLVFTLTVFADAGGARQPAPLLVLNALTLRYADWSDHPAAS